jgi:chemotaxis protein CheY-P-specific phosphatase CheC
MRAAAPANAELSSLLSIGAGQGAQALAGIAGGEVRAGVVLEPEPAGLGRYEAGVAFEVGEALEGSVLVLFAPEAHARLLAALGSRAEADPGAALSEVANIVASQAVSAIADALRARVTLSIPRLRERGGGLALVRALRTGAPALASELHLGDTGSCVLLVLLAGGRCESALP